MNTHIITGVTKDGSRLMYNFNTGSWTDFNPKAVRKGHKCDGGAMCHTSAQINAEVTGIVLVGTQSYALTA